MHRIGLILAVSTLTSCVVVYQPPSQPVPMFTKKGEAQAFVGYRNAGLSYALTNKFGLSLNGYYRKNQIITLYDGSRTNPRGLQRMVQLTAVHYTPTARGSFEFLWGYGRGYSSLSYGGGGGLETLDSHFNFFTIQPNIIAGTGKTKLCYSARLSIIDLYDFRYAPGQSPSRMTGAFLEPAFSLRHRVGFASLNAQVQASLCLSPPIDYALTHPYRGMMSATVGVGFHVDELFPAAK